MMNSWILSSATGLGFIMVMVIFNEWEWICEIKLQGKKKHEAELN